MNELWKRFKAKGFSPMQYSRAHKLSRETLYKVLNEKYDGSKRGKTGETRRIILKLKEDGVYIGKLAWE